MMYHVFNIGTYFPQSTKVLLGYVVMHVKFYIWAKWDLGTPGVKHSFFANLYRFCSKLAEYHRLAQPAKYKSLHMAMNTKDHVSFLLQKYYLYGYILYLLVLKNSMPFISIPGQLLVFSVSFILFLVLNPHIGYNYQPCIILLGLKSPPSSPANKIFS